MNFVIYAVLFAFVPNSVVVDGNFHRDQQKAYFLGIRWGDMETQQDTTPISIDSVYLKWDTVNLYFVVKNHNTFDMTKGDIFIPIDMNTPGAGGTYSPFVRHVRFSGNLPDFVVMARSNTNAALFKWNGTQWTRTSIASIGGGGTQNFEIAVPMDSLGISITRQDTLNINYGMYTCGTEGDGIPDYNKNDNAYSAINLDPNGNAEADYTVMGTSSQSGGSSADLNILRATYDSTFLYVNLYTNNNGNASVNYGFAFDIDNIPGSGYMSGGDASGVSIDFYGNPFAPEYEAYFYWNASTKSMDSGAVYRWSGSAWNEMYTFTKGTDYQYKKPNDNKGLEQLEFKIPWDSIGGVPKNINMNCWVSGKGSTSSAVDVIPYDTTCSNPGGSGEWTDTDTFSTHAVIWPDAPPATDYTEGIKGGGAAPDTVVPGITTLANTQSDNSVPRVMTYWYYNPLYNLQGFLQPSDGFIDMNGFEWDEVLFADDAHNAYLTWDNDSIYFGYTYQDFAHGDFMIYIDVDSVTSPDSGNGTRYAINWWSSDTIILPFKADYTINVEDGNYYALLAYQSGSWNLIGRSDQGSFPGAGYIGWSGNKVTEISLARSAIGNPTWTAYKFFCHSEDASSVFGDSPGDGIANVNNDGANDTLNHFWGYYKWMGTNEILVSYYLDQWPVALNIREQNGFGATSKRPVLMTSDEFQSYTAGLKGCRIYDAAGRFIADKSMMRRLRNIKQGIYVIVTQGRIKRVLVINRK